MYRGGLRSSRSFSFFIFNLQGNASPTLPLIWLSVCCPSEDCSIPPWLVGGLAGDSKPPFVCSVTSALWYSPGSRPAGFGRPATKLLSLAPASCRGRQAAGSAASPLAGAAGTPLSAATCFTDYHGVMVQALAPPLPPAQEVHHRAMTAHSPARRAWPPAPPPPG